MNFDEYLFCDNLTKLPLMLVKMHSQSSKSKYCSTSETTKLPNSFWTYSRTCSWILTMIWRWWLRFYCDCFIKAFIAQRPCWSVASSWKLARISSKINWRFSSGNSFINFSIMCLPMVSLATRTTLLFCIKVSLTSSNSSFKLITCMIFWSAQVPLELQDILTKSSPLIWFKKKTRWCACRHSMSFEQK